MSFWYSLTFPKSASRAWAERERSASYNVFVGNKMAQCSFDRLILGYGLIQTEHLNSSWLVWGSACLSTDSKSEDWPTYYSSIGLYKQTTKRILDESLWLGHLVTSSM